MNRGIFILLYSKAITIFFIVIIEVLSVIEANKFQPEFLTSIIQQ